MHSLPIFVRLQGRPVILAGDSDAAEAKRRLLERAGAVIVGEDQDAALAIVAMEQPEATAARLRARGILVNVADRPDLCDFTLPAIVDRDPVLIAIGTGGASAGLAKALRQRLESLLPASLGALATGLREARATIRARWPEAAERRHAIDAALEPGGLLDPFSSRTDVGDWLGKAAGPAETQIVPFRLASPDPDDLTLRQARLLGKADRVYHRADVPSAILDRSRADATRIACDHPPVSPPPGLSIDISMETA
ncbi:NAD(P)-dependent oxidoreductase [Sphingomonas tabacisoli]|uniref:precorrin-2 dehydrogenase n=1 Tax=Sphingomonas tabacisoli TaxID=2249466 RepID=A0ABW4HZ53_9SPHN